MVHRHLEAVVTDALSEARVVCVLGPRQSGKSTLVSELAEGAYPAEIHRLDVERTRLAALSDPDGFIAQINGPAVIDEVQRAPDLLLAIKARVDASDARGQFLLTGSADVTMLSTVADALPGRVDYLHLAPFTQGELAGARETFIDRLFKGESPSVAGIDIGRSAYARAIIRGGYPEAQNRSAQGRERFFTSYLDSLLGRDLSEVANLRTARRTHDLLRLLAAHTGGLVSYSALGQTLAFNYKTAQAHCDALENLFLIHQLRPWYENYGQRVVKAPKCYISDPGLFSHLIGGDERRLLDDDLFAGQAFETFVITELIRQSEWAAKAVRFFFYRDKGGREVDLLIERANGDVVGIEVKATTSARKRDFHALEYLRDRLGSRFKAGVVITTGSETLAFGDRLSAMPIAAIWGRRPAPRAARGGRGVT